MKGGLYTIFIPAMFVGLYTSSVISDYCGQWLKYRKERKSGSARKPGVFRALRLESLRD
jgi:hypothetical protein